MEFLWRISVIFLAKAVVGCNMFQKRLLNCYEVKELLHIHNLKRKEVATGTYINLHQSKAENMHELRWNARLMKESQAFVNKCQFRHDPDKKPIIAESLAASYYKLNTDYNLTEMVYLWFDELKEIGYGGTYNHRNVHYHTMIWSGFKTIGCGLSSYEPDDKFRDDYYRAFLVCRYYPYEHQDGTYSKGEPNCSKHNLHDSVKYKGLCSDYSAEVQTKYNPCENLPTDDSNGSSNSLYTNPVICMFVFFLHTTFEFI